MFQRILREGWVADTEGRHWNHYTYIHIYMVSIYIYISDTNGHLKAYPQTAIVGGHFPVLFGPDQCG